jgi:PTH2 family peptidyl-tRNA hydrolase
MKLALVVRTDLDMGRGKIAAQVAHAAVAAVLTSIGGAVFQLWLENGQPKVVLKVPDEDALNAVISKARAGDLRVEAVYDAGRTQIPSGTLTCCAIGPARAERIDAVTAGLGLL